MTDAKKPDSQMLNRLRAAVLGANDGVVSTASVLMGVVGAGAGNTAVVTAGMAALVAGALSMAVGEYVSVASQRDAEEAHAKKVDHSDDDFVSPMQAAIASMVSFTVGGGVPFLAAIFASKGTSVFFIVTAATIALFATGFLSAKIGKAPKTRAILRVTVGGLIAMALTYFIGVGFGQII